MKTASSEACSNRMQPNGASPQRGAAFLKGEGKTIKQPFSRDTVRLTAVQVAYWAWFCAVMSYATVFLLSLGYSSAAAGAVIAAGNLAGILLQPLCAGLVPRAGSARTVVLGMALALAALAGALCLLGRLAPACAALIILMYGLLYTMQGLLNAIAMELSNAGRRVDYGFARGMGSMGYAVCSWAVGGITAAVGAGALPFVHLALLAALGLCMLLLPQSGRHCGVRGPAPAGGRVCRFEGRPRVYTCAAGLHRPVHGLQPQHYLYDTDCDGARRQAAIWAPFSPLPPCWSCRP